MAGCLVFAGVFVLYIGAEFSPPTPLAFVVLFIAFMMVVMFTLMRRLSDLGYSPEAVRSVIVVNAAVVALVGRITDNDPLFQTVGLTLIALVFIAAGIAPGIRGESNGYPNPRRRSGGP